MSWSMRNKIGPVLIFQKPVEISFFLYMVGDHQLKSIWFFRIIISLNILAYVKSTKKGTNLLFIER